VGSVLPIWLRQVGLPLQLSLPRARRLAHLGVVLRWVAIGFAGLAGVMLVRPPSVLVYDILAAILYNGLVMVWLSRTDDAGLPRIALVTTAMDQVFDFVFIAIYASALPVGAQVACYFMGLIEAIGYFGIAGAVLSVSMFVLGMVAVEGVYFRVTGTTLGVSDLIGSPMIVALAAGTLASVNQVVMGPLPESKNEPKPASGEPNGAGRVVAPAIRLSKRQHDVLQLVAEGYSNSMIASRLRLSDNTVKSYVEDLLNHLNARNRAEAVAAASRLHLI
jgi:DNA-binding CsgD family transcriptional regulator